MQATTPKFSWIVQIIAVIIMGQTLFYKFTGHEQTLAIFQELNMPHGHYVIGTLELIACILLLTPQAVVWGAILTCGLMAGAIMGHITQLGWAGERGFLGTLAVITFLSALTILFLRRHQIPILKGIIHQKSG